MSEKKLKFMALVKQDAGLCYVEKPMELPISSLAGVFGEEITIQTTDAIDVSGDVRVVE